MFADSALVYCSMNISSERTILLWFFGAVFWQQLPAETATGNGRKRK
jgi:hypothetical protein